MEKGFEHYKRRVLDNWDAWLCRCACPDCIARESCAKRRDMTERPKIDYDTVCASNVGDGSADCGGGM